ncbi:HupE/UreJ family protein [Gloeocapsa sp. PCC 73106]|uniref:HupE/UreJ family protein n=1 Tax=Gloeocapsa sp. PCC 73106 TaxID=102232 RepID=UPI00031DE60E|nr:HupE/UreJ family protein [Gloeocapsa sp. PCC 73106]
MNQYSKSLTFLTITIFLLGTFPVLAHHPMGGKVPGNFFEGFISGLGHPIIGPDHFAFVISVGLLAAVSHQGFKILIAFVLTAIAGTGLHLMEFNLPGAEFVISGSVLLFGILLALSERPNGWILTGLAAFIGLFHGYAYGESIVGAEMTPLIAYLLGFTLIQLIVAIVASRIGRVVLKKAQEPSSLFLRFAGFIICGMGFAFLSTLLVELL